MIGQSKMNEMNERLHDMTSNGMLFIVKEKKLKRYNKLLILIRLYNPIHYFLKKETSYNYTAHNTIQLRPCK